MKILHVDEQTGWRGGEQQASWLMQRLAERGHRIAVAARADSAFIAHEHGGIAFEAYPVALRGELDFTSARRMARIVAENRIDVLHAHSSHAHTLCCLARRFAGRGAVVVSRRVSFMPRRHPLNRIKYRMPDLYLSVSGHVDRVLAEFGIPQSKRRVVFSAVDLERCDVAPIARRELGVPDEAPLLVSAGALVGHKDHVTLVEAMARVVQRYPKARLVVAGEGEMRDTIENRVRELGLGDAVTLLGHRTDVPAIIKAGDVYVSSSWSEGLGTSVLEALACETPVVATEAGGVPEMVLDGETGYLVANRDPDALARAIGSSLEHREQARAMASAGRAHVERHFTVKRMVEDTLAAYEHAVRLRQGPAAP